MSQPPGSAGIRTELKQNNEPAHTQRPPLFSRPPFGAQAAGASPGPLAPGMNLHTKWVLISYAPFRSGHLFIIVIYCRSTDGFNYFGVSSHKAGIAAGAGALSASAHINNTVFNLMKI